MNKENVKHWYYGENLFLKENNNALFNLKLGVMIMFEFETAMFADYEEFTESIAQIEFFTGDRPDDVEPILIEAWNFMVLHDQEEERLAIERELDEDDFF